jgi:hypothetical protein
VEVEDLALDAECGVTRYVLRHIALGYQLGNDYLEAVRARCRATRWSPGARGSLVTTQQQEIRAVFEHR